MKIIGRLPRWILRVDYKKGCKILIWINSRKRYKFFRIYFIFHFFFSIGHSQNHKPAYICLAFSLCKIPKSRTSKFMLPNSCAIKITTHATGQGSIPNHVPLLSRGIPFCHDIKVYKCHWRRCFRFTLTSSYKHLPYFISECKLT